MARVLLDTDILSEIIKKKNEQVLARAIAYLASQGRFTLSVLSVMEIVYGFRRLDREDRIEQFRSLIADHEVVSLDASMAASAGRIYADLERRGTPIGLSDVLIASVALHLNVPLITGNLKHFQAIRNAGHPLKLGNWREPLPSQPPTE